MTHNKLRDFGRSLPMALLKSREVVMTHFRPILREHDITEQQWRVLRALNGTSGLEITALANACLILMPSLTRILKALEAKGLIKRFVVKSDHRRSIIRLSKKGEELYKTVSPLSEAEYQRITSALGEKKLKLLYELLDDISDLL